MKILIIIIMCSINSCLTLNDSTIIENSESADNSNVINGIAYDLSVLTINERINKIKIPKDVIEVKNSENNEIRIFSKKIVNFWGHPPGKISPKIAREFMGFAYKENESILSIATFGEWNTKKEGGALIEFKIEVPKGIEIIKEDSLSSENSLASSYKLYAKEDGKYWYADITPSAGWSTISSKPYRESTSW